MVTRARDDRYLVATAGAGSQITSIKSRVLGENKHLAIIFSQSNNKRDPSTKEFVLSGRQSLPEALIMGLAIGGKQD